MLPVLATWDSDATIPHLNALFRQYRITWDVWDFCCPIRLKGKLKGKLQWQQFPHWYQRRWALSSHTKCWWLTTSQIPVPWLFYCHCIWVRTLEALRWPDRVLGRSDVGCFVGRRTKNINLGIQRQLERWSMLASKKHFVPIHVELRNGKITSYA